MIMREWRGSVPRDKADAYVEVLERTGLKDYADTPGNRGVFLLREDGEHETEFVTLTLWESEDAVRDFAGKYLLCARYYPEDHDFLLAFAEFVRHYQVNHFAMPR